MQRLGRNLGGYFGEGIDVATVLGKTRIAAERHGWRVTSIPAAPGIELVLCLRHVESPRFRLYISTGIHGDEPAGPLAIQQLVEENQWPPGVAVWLCPCLNPTGLSLIRRENVDGIDLNRDYRSLKSPEVRAHIAWLKDQPSFDLCLCLHEDWEAHGFYLYELNPDRRPSLASRMITAVAPVCPIDQSVSIDGREAKGGIIAPDLDPFTRTEWPEAFFLITHKTRHSYTLEAPSDFPLATRVAALVAAMQTVLLNLQGATKEDV